MKKVLWLLSVLPLLWSAHAAAAPCTTGPLASYLLLGPSGCTVGSANFSNFGTPAIPNNATEIAIASIVVTPVTTMNGVGFDFGANVAPALFSYLDRLITYRVSGVGASLIGASATLLDSSATASGFVTDIQNYCLGGVFGPDGVSNCTGTADGFNLFVTGDDAILSAAIGPFTASFLMATADFSVDTTDGNASLGAVRNLYLLRGTAAVPEPGALALLSVGLLAAALARRPSRRRAR